MLVRLVLPLAYLSALTGCMTPPPKGAVVEYRDGQTPVTKPIKYEATYALCAADQPPGTPPLTSHQLAKGERIGFCRAADGTVHAVAPGYSIALPPGAHSWECVPGSGPSESQRMWCAVRDRSIFAGKVILVVAGVTFLVLVVLGVLIIIAFAKGGLNYS